MKIAITGTGGIGKTTLALALSEHYNIHHIKEDFRPIEDAMMALRKIPVGNKKSQIKASEKLYNEINLWLQNRMRYFGSDTSFVEDRFCLDVLIYLSNPITSISEPQLREFIQRCIEYTKIYDAVIIPPIINTSETNGLNEDGLIRQSSLSSKIRSHSLLIGLLEQFCSAPKIYIAPNCQTTEQRIAYVDSTLKFLKKA